MKHINLILDFSFSYGPRYLARASGSKPTAYENLWVVGEGYIWPGAENLGTLGYALPEAGIFGPGSIALLFT